ncbi:MFS transporter [Desulfosporosinus sp. SYSU MS00001]|uniref:MFS transporter n=1 Tax=Desulfosporosinus sp. SYSU MS00001 TaxID=3416284 RepID=UPI003CE85D42
MSELKSINTKSTEQTVSKNALIFGLISVFLYGIGFGLTAPVVPFLVQPFVKSPGNQAIVVALLTFIYAVCVFFAAPGLGALSDRYGRRPILIICLLGSAAGYLIFGIGGALWVLFLGRIIDGLTGGNISTILAYFADITPADQRTKYFGWAGAAAGAGSIIGPSLGGLLANFGYSTPMYFGAIITLLNVVYGAIYMPESLSKDRRLDTISLARLNPFTQLASIVSTNNLKWIFIAIFLLGVPSGSLQTLFSQFAKDAFKWGPAIIGVMFSILGALDIITQSLIMPKLLKKLKVSQIAVLGMVSETIAYALIAVSGIFLYFPFFIAGTIVFGFGDAIFGPAVNGITSCAVSSDEQGRVQGGSQSVQALTRIIGPILGGGLYVSLGHYAPAVMGIILVAAAVAAMNRGTCKVLKS